SRANGGSGEQRWHDIRLSIDAPRWRSTRPSPASSARRPKGAVISPPVSGAFVGAFRDLRSFSLQHDRASPPNYPVSFPPPRSTPAFPQAGVGNPSLRRSDL